MQKSIIKTIGVIDDEGIPQGWTFDCQGIIPAISADDDGSILYGGYTIEELADITQKG